jgi:hypothetical protein
LQAKAEHKSAHEPDESGLEDKKETLLTDAEQEEKQQTSYGGKPWTNIEPATKPESTIV